MINEIDWEDETSISSLSLFNSSLKQLTCCCPQYLCPHERLQSSLSIFSAEKLNENLSRAVLGGVDPGCPYNTRCLHHITLSLRMSQLVMRTVSQPRDTKKRGRHQAYMRFDRLSWLLHRVLISTQNDLNRTRFEISLQSSLNMRVWVWRHHLLFFPPCLPSPLQLIHHDQQQDGKELPVIMRTFFESKERTSF